MRVCFDSHGNCFVSGCFDTDVQLGSFAYTSNGESDMFLAKLDPDGNFLWAKRAGSTGDDESYGLNIDSNNNALMSGLFSGTVMFGSHQLTSTGEFDTALTKLDSNGNFLWVKQAGSADNDVPGHISFDGAGDIYLTGTYYSGGSHNLPAYFDTHQITSSGSAEIFVAKLSGGVNQELPVELSSFTATVTSDMFVSLQWITQSETSNLGFNVLRSDTGIIATASKLNIGFISGTNTSSTHSYNFFDNEIDHGTTYYYWLEMVNFEGTSSYSNYINVNTSNQAPVIPTTTILRNVYPNPFRTGTSTNIEMDVKASETATLTIYNVLGQKVMKYVLQAGSYKITWNGRDENGDVCGSGIYFYKLSSPSINSTKKMVIIK